MQKLIVFNQISLDGYIADAHGDMRWAHKDRNDPEWNAFVASNASGGGILVFGRVTYQLMAGYWPTPMAAKNDPLVAQHMNSFRKIVFSRTLDQAAWNNTTLFKGNLTAEIRKLKSEPGPGMAILGSASIISQLAAENLIDQYQMVVNPIVLGRGKTMFETVTGNIPLKLTSTRAFKNGNVLLCYEPIN